MDDKVEVRGDLPAKDKMELSPGSVHALSD